MIISMNAGNSIGKNPIPFHDNSKIGKEKKKHLQNANRASFTWKEVSGMRKKSPSFKKKKYEFCQSAQFSDNCLKRAT